MKTIKIYGIGDISYQQLLLHVRQAILKKSNNYQLEEVEDIQQFLEKGLDVIPALVIDGKLVSKGEIPSVDSIVQWL